MTAESDKVTREMCLTHSGRNLKLSHHYLVSPFTGRREISLLPRHELRSPSLPLPKTTPWWRDGQCIDLESRYWAFQRYIEGPIITLRNGRRVPLTWDLPYIVTPNRTEVFPRYTYLYVGRIGHNLSSGCSVSPQSVSPGSSFFRGAVWHSGDRLPGANYIIVPNGEWRDIGNWHIRWQRRK